MIERSHRCGRLVFDRDAIVRAALRAYVEAVIAEVGRHNFPPCVEPRWTGNLQRGAFYNGNGGGDYEVTAWTEAGVVGLAYELGFGPLERLGLAVDAVTRGPDDVRGALPGLPAALESALVMAAGMLRKGNHGEKLAGIGFWFCGDHVDGTLFGDPTGPGVRRLAAWGLLQDGRLPRLCDPRTAAKAAELDRTRFAPIHAIIDAVVDRALGGPTEFTTDEIAMLIPKPPDPERLLSAQRSLQTVGITWPGSPELSEAPRQRVNPFTGEPLGEADRPAQ
jgi:hypothetical protein